MAILPVGNLAAQAIHSAEVSISIDDIGDAHVSIFYQITGVSEKSGPSDLTVLGLLHQDVNLQDPQYGIGTDEMMSLNLEKLDPLLVSRLQGFPDRHRTVPPEGRAASEPAHWGRRAAVGPEGRRRRRSRAAAERSRVSAIR